VSRSSERKFGTDALWFRSRERRDGTGDRKLARDGNCRSLGWAEVGGRDAIEFGLLEPPNEGARLGGWGIAQLSLVCPPLLAPSLKVVERRIGRGAGSGSLFLSTRPTRRSLGPSGLGVYSSSWDPTSLIETSESSLLNDPLTEISEPSLLKGHSGGDIPGRRGLASSEPHPRLGDPLCGG